MSANITEAEIVAAAKVIWNSGKTSPPWDAADAMYLRWKHECMELAYEILLAAKEAR